MSVVAQVDDLMDHLRAGRRAASQALIADPIVDREHLGGPAPEVYNGTGGLVICGTMDVGPAVDAAVMETIVRMQLAPVRASRPWWKFWRAR